MKLKQKIVYDNIIMLVQAILFPKDKYTLTQANTWIKAHKVKILKEPHITERYIRYRVSEPNDSKQYKTKELKGHIYVIYTN